MNGLMFVKSKILGLTRQQIQVILAVAVLTFFVFLRLLPHAPNFSPIGAVAFISGIWFLKRSWFLLVPITLVFFTDLILGMYDGIAFTYFAYVLIFSMGALFASFKFESKVIKSTYFILMNISASVLFFIISNLGVWWSTPLYSHDFQGFVECFVLAIPFYPMSLTSQLLYALVLQIVMNFAFNGNLHSRRVSA